MPEDEPEPCPEPELTMADLVTACACYDVEVRRRRAQAATPDVACGVLGRGLHIQYSGLYICAICTQWSP